MWSSNCSDDINSTVCDYATQVAWKVTNTTMEHYREKDSLAGLTAKWHLLALKSSSITRLGLDNGTSGNLLPKNLGLGLDITQGPVVVIVTISFIIITSYFIQACVPLPSVIAIGSLQFNKTLCSVTCINCKLYTCLNSSISLRNESLLILQS